MRNDAFVEVRTDASIPQNNVDLESDNKQLQCAGELAPEVPGVVARWAPKAQDAEVYLRTAVGVDPTGWAKFGS